MPKNIKISPLAVQLIARLRSIDTSIDPAEVSRIQWEALNAATHALSERAIFVRDADAV